MGKRVPVTLDVEFMGQGQDYFTELNYVRAVDPWKANTLITAWSNGLLEGERMRVTVRPAEGYEHD